MIKFLLLSITQLFLVGTFVMAQNYIQGRILDESKAPLPFASIVITHRVENGNEVAMKYQLGASSDMEGYYVLPSVPDGSYMVKVIYMGYKQVAYPMNLGLDDLLGVVLGKVLERLCVLNSFSQ